MNRIALISTWLLGWQLAGCTLPPVIPVPEPPELPTAWGAYGQEFWEGTKCPKVSGRFAKIPTIYEAGKTNVQFLVGSDINFYSLFAFHLAKDLSKPAEPTQNDPAYFVIDQEAAERFTLLYYAPEIRSLVRLEFEKSEGDFACMDGFIQFPVSGYFGSIEGMPLNGQILKKFRLTASGDLISIHSSGPYRSSRSAQSLDFEHEFYLFRRK